MASPITASAIALVFAGSAAAALMPEMPPAGGGGVEHGRRGFGLGLAGGAGPAWAFRPG
jgi:hypothetical protein